MNKLEKQYINEVCDAEAALEEAAVRGQELKKLQYDFQREILKGAVVDGSDKIQAEAIERYFEQRLHARDMLIEQLRLQDARLKV